MSIIAPIALLTIAGRRDPLLSVSSQDFFLADLRDFLLALLGAWVKGGVINTWPVKHFETVMVIKGYPKKNDFEPWTIGQTLQPPS